MDPQTRAIKPTEYEGVKLVSFGYAGQGSAIMRGPMVSGGLLLSGSVKEQCLWQQALWASLTAAVLPGQLLCCLVCVIQ